jgi:hypothetical protein
MVAHQNESFYVQSDWISMKTIDRKPHIYALLLLYEFVPYEILDLSNEQILFGNKYSERVSWDQLVDQFQTQMPVKGDCDDLVNLLFHHRMSCYLLRLSLVEMVILFVPQVMASNQGMQVEVIQLGHALAWQIARSYTDLID